MIATVDSGANRTYFPLQIAARLGITPAELVKAPNPSIGVGSTFETWSSAVNVTAQIVAYFAPGPGQVQTPTIWGPQITLVPSFGNPSAFLLGQHDFFRTFTTTFQAMNDPPVFHLDY